VTERERAYRYDFMRQFCERRVPNVFLEPSFLRGVSFSYNIIPCGGSEWLRNIKAPKTIHQQRSIMSVRLTTIGKPPSIMKVELMKRRGIMPTWPMAMLVMQGTMRRKLVNITLRNMVRKNRLINRGRSVRCRDRSLCQAGGAKLAPLDLIRHAKRRPNRLAQPGLQIVPPIIACVTAGLRTSSSARAGVTFRSDGSRPCEA